MRVDRPFQPAAPAYGRGRAERMAPHRVGDEPGRGRIVLVLAQRLVVADPGAQAAVAAIAFQGQPAPQAVGLGDVVVQQIGAVGRGLHLRRQRVVARQRETRGAKDVAPRLAGADVVARDGAVPFRRAVLERLPVAQFHRRSTVGGEIGGERHVGVFAQRDEVGQLDPEPQRGGGAEARAQEAGHPLDRRVGGGQRGQRRYRQAEGAELGPVKVKLAGLAVVGDAAGADLPQRRRVVGADLA